MIIKRNDDYCYMDNGTFPYCQCRPTNKEIAKHEKFNREGCYYIDKIFSTSNVKRMIKYLSDFELYEVSSWLEVYENWNITNIETIMGHFTWNGKFLIVKPKFLCVRVDDEFEHSIKLKLDHSMFNGYDRLHTKENGKSMQAWAILNTDNDDYKIICQCVVWNEFRN